MESDYIKLIITDVDGTLTDGSVWELPTGPVRAFSTLDGHGFEIAKDAKVRVIMMTRSNSADIRQRTHHLGVECFQHIKYKAAAVKTISVIYGISLDSICFMGNDITDLGAMDICGYSACPADAHPSVLAACEVTGFTSRYNGGHGAFRQLIDWLEIQEYRKKGYPVRANIESK